VFANYPGWIIVSLRHWCSRTTDDIEGPIFAAVPDEISIDFDGAFLVIWFDETRSMFSCVGREFEVVGEIKQCIYGVTSVACFRVSARVHEIFQGEVAL
jgi:hypothetical protein